MSIIGDIGNFLTGGSQQGAQNAEAQAIQNLQGVNTPTVQSMILQLQKEVQQGNITPEQAQTYLQNPSLLNSIQPNSTATNAQNQALQSLQQIGASGGLNNTDLANLQQIQTQQNAQARGQNQAIVQRAQQQGLGNSGLSLMAQLQNQQAAATNENQNDLSIAGQAQQRALSALQGAGSLGTSIENQDFNQQAQVAAAQNAINQFNTQNQQNTGNLNVANNLAAQNTNLSLAQNTANQNVGLSNQEQQYNTQLQQQNFNNQWQKATGIANQYQNQANLDTAQGGQNLGIVGAGLGAAGSAIGGLSGGEGSEEEGGEEEGYKRGGLVGGRPTPGDSIHAMLQPGEMVVPKKHVPEMLKKMHTDDKGNFDMASFLDDITGGKYGYAKHEKEKPMSHMPSEIEKLCRGGIAGYQNGGIVDKDEELNPGGQKGFSVDHKGVLWNKHEHRPVAKVPSWKKA